MLLMLMAALVSLPAVGTGLLNDDYCHRALLVGSSESLERLSEVGLKPEGSGCLSTAVFGQFIAVDPEKNLKDLQAYGALPWWTCDELRIAFWRPVAAFTHWLDHRFLPNSVAWMHVHSIGWFLAAVGAVCVLYRRLIGVAWIATLAALMYLLADFSYFPTMWLANRNALISLFFGVAALILHDRHRSSQRRCGSGRDGHGLGWVEAPACLLLSLLSAEAGVATLAYLLAYELLLRQERPTVRLRALAPFVLVTVGWRIVYNVLGYGASGGGFYLDPAREPLRYGLAVLDRAPFFLAGQWTTLPPEVYSMLSGGARQVLWGGLLLVTIAIPIALGPVLVAHRRARFWLLGMYLSALPVCATVPMSRALFFVALGGFGVVAEFVAGWQQQAAWVPSVGMSPRGGMSPLRRQGQGRRRLIGILVLLAVLLHLPWAVVRRALVPQVTHQAIERRVNGTVAIDNLWWWRHEDLVVVNAPNPSAFLYDPFRHAYHGRRLPGGVRVLAPAFGALEIMRPQPCRLVVRSRCGSLLDGSEGPGLHFVFFYRRLSEVRGSDPSLRIGRRIVLPRMTVELTRVDERGRPVEAAFDFPVPLEDASLQWVYWDWQVHDYVLFRLPLLGQTVTLAGPFP